MAGYTGTHNLYVILDRDQGRDNLELEEALSDALNTLRTPQLGDDPLKEKFIVSIDKEIENDELFDIDPPVAIFTFTLEVTAKNWKGKNTLEVKAYDDKNVISGLMYNREELDLQGYYPDIESWVTKLYNKVDLPETF